MKISASSSTTETKTYETPDAGTYSGRCIRIVDLGNVEHERFKDKDGNPQIEHKIEIVWELSELMQDGRPFVVSRKFTPSLNEKSTLRQVLVAWRNKPFTADELNGFDINNLLDKTCFISIMHQPWKNNPEKFNVEVKSVGPLPKGMTCPDRVNDLFVFDISTDINDAEKLKLLWPSQRKVIERSFEWKKFYGDKTVSEVVEQHIRGDQEDEERPF